MKHIYLLIILFTITGFSQRLKIKEGDVKLLKGVENYNLVFDYTNLQIVNYESEAVFLKEKIDLREKKLKGKGEEFKKDWFNNRTKLYEPYFENHFNDYFIMKKKIFISKTNSNAKKYTILVKSLKLYPGYNVVAAWESAKLWVEIIIYETENPKNIILRFKPLKIYHGYSNMDLGKRVANAYGVSGETLANFLRKKT